MGEVKDEANMHVIMMDECGSVLLPQTQMEIRKEI